MGSTYAVTFRFKTREDAREFSEMMYRLKNISHHESFKKVVCSDIYKDERYDKRPDPTLDELERI